MISLLVSKNLQKKTAIIRRLLKKLKKQKQKRETVMLDDSSSDSESELRDDDDQTIASGDTESSFDEEDMFEETYDLPKHLKSNTKLKKRFDMLVNRIKSQEPSIDQIFTIKDTIQTQSRIITTILHLSIFDTASL